MLVEEDGSLGLPGDADATEVAECGRCIGAYLGDGFQRRVPPFLRALLAPVRLRRGARQTDCSIGQRLVFEVKERDSDFEDTQIDAEEG